MTPHIFLCACFGFVWQGFGSVVTTRVAFVRSCQKFSQCQPSFRIVLPLTKTKPIRDSSSASVVTYLRGKTAAQLQLEERSENM